jgi:hypothetical protein
MNLYSETASSASVVPSHTPRITATTHTAAYTEESTPHFGVAGIVLLVTIFAFFFALYFIQSLSF